MIWQDAIDYAAFVGDSDDGDEDARRLEPLTFLETVDDVVSMVVVVNCADAVAFVYGHRQKHPNLVSPYPSRPHSHLHFL